MTNIKEAPLDMELPPGCIGRCSDCGIAIESYDVAVAHCETTGHTVRARMQLASTRFRAIIGDVE